MSNLQGYGTLWDNIQKLVLKLVVLSLQRLEVLPMRRNNIQQCQGFVRLNNNNQLLEFTQS